MLATNIASAAQIWSGFQGDATHDGYVPGSYNPAAFTLAWQVGFTVPTAQHLTPAVAGNGDVFLVQSSYEYTPSYVYAYNSRTGSPLWTASLGTPDQFGEYLYGASPAAYGNGNVYLETEGSGSAASLLAFSGATGSVVFSSPLSSQGVSVGNPTVIGNSVYGENGGIGGVGAFNATTGEQTWQASVPFQNGWSVAANSVDLFLYLGEGSASPGPSPGRLYAINRTTGAIDFQILDPKSNTSDALMDPTLGPNNDAFVISGDPVYPNGSRLIRFNLANQTISWQRPATTNEGYTGDIALANQRLYTEDSGILTVLDENTGSLLWTWAPSGQSLSGNLIVTDSDVFVSSGSNLYAISLLTDLPVWSANFSGTLSMADDMLFAVGQNSLQAYSLGAPVPEPSSFCLAAVGVALAIANCWQRKRLRGKPDRSK